VVYKPSEPRRRWASDRLARIDVLATGHASVSGVAGPGRPKDASKPLAHAYIIGMLSEFQGFVRDLHDLAVERVVSASGAASTFAPILIDGMTAGRGIDRGNATTPTVKSDFARIGLSPLNPALHNSRWSKGDSAEFDLLVRLRNALGHGNETELRALLAGGAVKDTVSWARARLPLINRYVRALDKLVWNHLVRATGKEPWS
jgi:hypothetical protein